MATRARSDWDDPLAPIRATSLWQLVEEAGIRSGSMLDAGCGEGILVADAAARGFCVTGMDLSSHAIERAQAHFPNFTFHVHSVEDIPWPVAAASVDVVASFEVIEHLLQPSLLIQGANRALRPGGYLALTTPYHGLLKNLALSFGAFDRHFAVEGDHIRFFSDTALRDLLRRNGFTTERILHFGRARSLWADTFIWAKKDRDL